MCGVQIYKLENGYNKIKITIIVTVHHYFENENNIKRRKRKDLPHKIPSEIRLLNKRHERKVRVRGLQKMAKEVDLYGRRFQNLNSLA